jgi:tripeptidyl-peptidase I
MLSTTFLLSLFAVAAAAKPAARMVVHESRDDVPSGYVRVKAADPNQEVRLRIALTQNNMDGLIKALYDVSTPSSAAYGEHLSKEEVRRHLRSL